MNQLAVSEGARELFQSSLYFGDAAENARGWHDRHVVLGEIDAGFHLCNQLDELLLYRRETFGECAFELLCGDSRLVERLRVDEIANGFGLREIDATVEECTHG